MRKAELLEITAQPAATNFGSNSRAMGASMDEKIIRGSSAPAPSGMFGCSTIFAMRAGSGVSSFQWQASAYVLPALRSLAASQVMLNHGWSARSWMNRWPTAPVAPKMPTLRRSIHIG
jgi:hypothetical protein